MSKYCPVLQSDVTYLVCQDCDDKECEKDKRLYAEKGINDEN